MPAILHAQLSRQYCVPRSHRRSVEFYCPQTRIADFAQSLGSLPISTVNDHDDFEVGKGLIQHRSDGTLHQIWTIPGWYDYAYQG